MSGCGPDEFYSALVGDAAHPTRPSLGQGANMALEDAVQLALSLHETGSVGTAVGTVTIVDVAFYLVPGAFFLSLRVVSALFCLMLACSAS